MLISVVIPLYNKKKSILRTVSSVLQQTYEDFEIILVDDGSTDGGMETLESITDPRLKRYNKKNSGVSDTRNKAMELASGEVIAFLDGDDLWDPYYLERLHAMVSQYPDCGLYMQDSIDIPEKQAGQAKGSGTQQEIKRFINWEHFFYYRNFKTSALSVNKKKGLALGGFDPSLTIGEDLDFWLRLILSYPVCFLNEIHVFILQYDEEYHSRFVPKDFHKHLSYKLITQKDLYLNIKDNKDVRFIMNKMIFYALLGFHKDHNHEAVSILSKNLSFLHLNWKDKIKFILHRFGLYSIR